MHRKGPPHLGTRMAKDLFEVAARHKLHDHVHGALVRAHAQEANNVVGAIDLLHDGDLGKGGAAAQGRLGRTERLTRAFAWAG